MEFLKTIGVLIFTVLVGLVISPISIIADAICDIRIRLKSVTKKENKDDN